MEPLMIVFLIDENVWHWARTSLGVLRIVCESREELCQHRPEKVRRALDRVYRRRRFVQGQEYRDGCCTHARLRRHHDLCANTLRQGYGTAKDCVKIRRDLPLCLKQRSIVPRLPAYPYAQHYSHPFGREPEAASGLP